MKLLMSYRRQGSLLPEGSRPLTWQIVLDPETVDNLSKFTRPCHCDSADRVVRKHVANHEPESPVEFRTNKEGRIMLLTTTINAASTIEMFLAGNVCTCAIELRADSADSAQFANWQPAHRRVKQMRQRRMIASGQSCPGSI